MNWVDYTPATQVRRRLRASGQRELIEANLKWNIDNLSDSSCSTIIPNNVDYIKIKIVPYIILGRVPLIWQALIRLFRC